MRKVNMTADSSLHGIFKKKVFFPRYRFLFFMVFILTIPHFAGADQITLLKTSDTESFYGVAISPDGKYIAGGFGGRDGGGMNLFEKNGKVIWEMPTEDKVSKVVISYNGDYVAGGSWNGTSYLIDRERKIFAQTKALNSISDVAISGDGSIFGVSSWDTYIYLYDRQGNLKWSYRLGEEPSGIAMNREGNYLVVGTRAKNVFLFDSNEKLLFKKQMEFEVQDVCLTASGDNIVIASENQVVFMTRNGEIIWKVNVGTRVNSVSISPEGDYIGLGLWNNMANIYSREGKNLWNYSLDDRVNDISLSGGGIFMGIATDNNLLRIDNTEKLVSLAQFYKSHGDELRGKNQFNKAIDSYEKALRIYYLLDTKAQIAALDALIQETGKLKNIYYIKMGVLGLLILIIGVILIDYNNNRVKIFFDIETRVFEEGENVTVKVRSKISGEPQSVSSKLYMDGSKIADIDPYMIEQNVILGVVPPGNYKLLLMAEAVKKRYGKTNVKKEGNLRINQVIPEINIIPDYEAESYQGIPMEARVKIQNRSRLAVNIKGKTLEPGKEIVIPYNLDTSQAGEVKKTVKLDFQTDKDSNFSELVTFNYKIKPLPEPRISIYPEVYAGKEGVIRIGFFNSSEVDVTDIRGTLKPADDLKMEGNYFELKRLQPDEERIFPFKVRPEVEGRYTLSVNLEYRVIGRLMEKELEDIIYASPQA